MGIITALDLEDTWKKEAKDFVPEERITEADKTNDMRSTKRKLNRPLRLLLKYKTGDREFWDLPQVVREEGETMRQTAERAVTQLCGSDMNFHVLGNAPLSFFKFKYSKNYQAYTNKVGAKVFIFKAFLSHPFHEEPGIQLGEDTIDYQWSTLDELMRDVNPHSAKALSNMLHSDD